MGLWCLCGEWRLWGFVMWMWWMVNGFGNEVSFWDEKWRFVVVIEMVKRNEENEGEEEQFRKSEGKGKRKGKRTCLKWEVGVKRVGPTVCSYSKTQNRISEHGDGRGVKNQDGRQQDVTSRPLGWTTVVTRHDGPPVVDFLKTVVDLLKLLWAIETYWETSYSKTC